MSASRVDPEPRGVLFDVQRFCLHDGPGIRTTVFLKGCPLSCPWCHNPEGISPRPELLVRSERCLGCEACVAACSETLPRPGQGRGAERIDRCLLCGACVEACPAEARELAGREVGVGELLAELSRDRIFFDDSRGGVTFSGGEPLGQPDFLLACLAACRAAGLRTAVDTSGLAPRSVLLAAALLADLFLFDVKLVDSDRHRAATGVANEPILDNLHALAEAHATIWLRVPLVPGVNDDTENLEATARLAASLPAVRRVCLLPYHRIGAGKRDRLGHNDGSPLYRTPGDDRMREVADLFRRTGAAARIGG